jgi:RNA polymerase sigma-70 factor (ECF subfamily)
MAHELEPIVKAQRARVRRVLRARGVADRDLPDAEQEVFLVVHRKLGEFEGRSTLATWVHGIAVNVASEHRRRACNRRESLAASEASSPVTIAASDPEAQLEARDALSRVRAALDSLSAEQREAFLLHELSGLSMHEIAQQLEVPLKTVFSRFYAARRGIALALARRGIAVSALWGWLALALPSRWIGRAHARVARVVHVAAHGAQLPLASLALVCILLPALSAPIASAPRIPISERARVAKRRHTEAAPALWMASPERLAASASASASASQRHAALRPAFRARRTARSHAAHRVADVRVASVARAAEVGPPTADALDDGLIVTRAGAEDLRPIGEHPFAARFPTYRTPARIELRGPRDAAAALEESIAESPLP